MTLCGYGVNKHVKKHKNDWPTISQYEHNICTENDNLLGYSAV
jgi:hypothetical protein